MRRLFLIIIIALLFSSCNTENTKHYSVSLTNNSSKIITYFYNGSIDTLAISEIKKYEVEAHTPSPKNIVDQNGIASIKMNTNGMTGNYDFSDAVPFNLNVVNQLLIEVKFKADNFINDNGSFEFSIGANEEKNTAIIYTLNPNFTSLIEYPVIIDWNISGNDIYVVTR